MSFMGHISTQTELLCQYKILSVCKYLTCMELRPENAPVPWFGERLRELREQRGYNLPEAAKKIGISTGRLSHIEGRKWPSEPKTVWKIVEKLGLDIRQLTFDLPARSNYGTGQATRPAGRPKNAADRGHPSRELRPARGRKSA